MQRCHREESGCELRILIVTPEYPPDFGGGIVTYYRENVSALRSIGYEVDVLVGSAFRHGQVENEDGRVSYLETSRLSEWKEHFSSLAVFPFLQRSLAAAFAIHEQCKRGEEYDVVEVTDWGMLFVPWLLMTECKVVVQLHGSCGQISHFEPQIGCEAMGMMQLLLETELFRDVPGLCSYSQNNCGWWGEKLGGSVKYIPPCLTVNGTAIGNLPGNATGPWITAGRIQRWKGPQVACQAWELLGTKEPNLEWIGRDTIFGLTGESTSKWLERTYPNVWGGSIKPVKQLTPGELKLRLASARAVLIPSSWDVFNYVGAEAMAVGKILVVSKGAGVADLVEDGHNGFVFDRDDAVGLKQKVEEVEALSDFERVRIENAAFETIKEKLDPIQAAIKKDDFIRSLTVAVRRNHWLQEAFLSKHQTDLHRFLDVFPIKTLLKRSFQRIVRKLIG